MPSTYRYFVALCQTILLVNGKPPGINGLSQYLSQCPLPYPSCTRMVNPPPPIKQQQQQQQNKTKNIKKKLRVFVFKFWGLRGS